MAVTIATVLLDRILAHAAGEPEREVCGLLFGGPGAVEDAQPTANVAPDPGRRFEIDPQTLFAAIRAERAGGPRMIGHYHSHPSASTQPSLRDAEAAVAGQYWLIVGGGSAALYQAEAGGSLFGAFTSVPLIVTD